MEDGGNVRGSDGVTCGVASSDMVVGGQGCGEWGAVDAKMNHMVSGGENRVDKGRAAEAKPNHLTVNAIFLSGESVSSKGGGHEFGNGRKSKVESLPADEKLDVGEGEGCGVRWGGSVLTRPEEVKESSAVHVSNGHAVRGIQERSHGDGDGLTRPGGGLAWE